VRGGFDFDISRQNYGPATFAVQQILHEWASVDWFSGEAAEPARAIELFRQHQTLAHAHSPELFPKDIDVRTSECDAKTFDAHCTQVRTGWDWKMSALKKLCSLHSKARGWTAEKQAAALQPELGHARGQLFVRLKNSAAWAVYPKEELGTAVPSQAVWYTSYARGDFIECIEWQLAEGTPDLAGNPFFPLVLCYVHGYYPFSFSRERFELCVPIAPVTARA
jgi:hypothetical protein